MSGRRVLKGIEGNWTSVQEEWSIEKDRLRCARDKWQSKTKTIEDNIPTHIKPRPLTNRSTKPNVQGLVTLTGICSLGMLTDDGEIVLTIRLNRSTYLPLPHFLTFLQAVTTFHIDTKLCLSYHLVTFIQTFRAIFRYEVLPML